MSRRTIKANPPPDQAAERAELIATLEEMLRQPGSELGRRLIRRRLQMLRGGQQLYSLDEINRSLGRGDGEDAHLS
jgi:hypothetical protein